MSTFLSHDKSFTRLSGRRAVLLTLTLLALASTLSGQADAAEKHQQPEYVEGK